jgi:hypothetical protein
VLLFSSLRDFARVVPPAHETLLLAQALEITLFITQVPQKTAHDI